jgi:hypothetical protein
MALTASDTDDALNDLRRVLRAKMVDIPPLHIPPSIVLDPSKSARIDEMYRMVRSIVSLPKPFKITLAKMRRNQLAAVHCPAEVWYILMGSPLVNGRNVISDGMATLTYLDIRYSLSFPIRLFPPSLL